MKVLFLIYFASVLKPAFSQQGTDSLLIEKDYANAKIYLKALHYDSAVYFLKPVVYAFQQSQYWDRYAEACYDLAEAYRIPAKYDSAILAVHEGLSRLNKSVGQRTLAFAKLLGERAVLRWHRGFLDSALVDNYNTLDIRKSILGGQHIEVANVYNNLGIVFTNKSIFDSALFYLQHSLDISMRLFGINHSALISTYLNIGVVFRQIGNYEKAEEFYNKALPIIINTLGENHPRTALVYTNLGTCYGITGNYERAVDYFNKSLFIRIKTLGENHPDVSDNYIGLALIEYERGQLRQSLIYEQKAADIRLKYFGDKSSKLAVCYNNIGNIYRELNMVDSASIYYTAAYKINLSEYTEHTEIAKGLTYFGDVAMMRSQMEEADSLYNLAFLMARNIHGHKDPLVSEMLMKRAVLSEKKGDIESALYYTQKALIASAISFDDTLLYSNPNIGSARVEHQTLQVLALKGKLLRTLFLKSGDFNYLEKSDKTFDLASEWIDYLRQGYRLEGSKLFLGTKAKRIYEDAIKTCLTGYKHSLSVHWIEKAFHISQRSKSGALREAIHELQIRNYTNIPDSISRLEREIKISLASYETQLIHLQTKKDSASRNESQKIEQMLFLHKARFDSLQNWIEKNNTAYFELKYKSSVPPLIAVQSELAKSSSTLIDYFVGDSIIVMFSISPQASAMFELPNEVLLEASVLKLRSYLNNIEPEKFIKESSDFFNVWLKPALKIASKEKPIIIIPDGILHYLPFEALVVGRYDEVHHKNPIRYLSEDYPIQYIFSTDRLFQSVKTNPSNSFFGFAPVFSDTSISGDILEYRFEDSTVSSMRGAFTRGSRFAALPYSQTEITKIQDLFTKRKISSKIVTHQKALKSVLTSDRLSEYGFVHFASHGFINEVNPKLSGIALYNEDSAGIKEDILYSGEIYNLRLNANLVTLSACKSALGKIEKGEGVIGLTRGFIYAGARHVLVSLWPVDDRLTSEFMTEFYRNVFTEKNLSLALQKTQKKWISQQQTSYPGDWGAFVLIGY